MNRILLTIMIALYSSGLLAKVDLENSFLLSAGMNKKEVLETMGGKPIASEFLGDLEEWHYCKDKSWLDGTKKFTTVFFYQGKVIGMKQYGSGDSGGCQRNIKGGNYQEPDVVKEYRIKMK